MTIDLSKFGGEAGREDTQWFTQDFAATLLSLQDMPRRTWLDAGAGLARSAQRIARHGFHVRTQDVAPELPVDYAQSIATMANKSFDVVSAFDVIEHIPTEDLLKTFLFDMRRIASCYVVVSTPFNAPSPYHYHVWTATQAMQATAGIGKLECAYAMHDGFTQKATSAAELEQAGAFAGLFIYSCSE